MDSIWMVPVTLAFYLYGSIPFAYIFVRRKTGERIFERGSGNVGVANAFRIGGLPAGMMTAAGEMSKALFPLLASFLLFEYDMTANVLFTGAALLGTNLSIFLRRKSGLGTTCVIYSLLIMSPFSLLGFLGAMGLGFVLTKRNGYVSGLVGYFSLPILLFIFNDSLQLVFWGAYAAVLFAFMFSKERDEYKHGFGYRKDGKNDRVQERREDVG
jgi:glycerol-3-phosphate acyltransferase PlsY